MATDKNGKDREYTLIEQAKKELGSKYDQLDHGIKEELQSIDKLRKLSDKYSLSSSDLIPA